MQVQISSDVNSISSPLASTRNVSEKNPQPRWLQSCKGCRFLFLCTGNHQDNIEIFAEKLVPGEIPGRLGDLSFENEVEENLVMRKLVLEMSEDL